MEIFKRGRGRPKKEEASENTSSVVPNVPSMEAFNGPLDVKFFNDDISENTNVSDLFDSDEPTMEDQQPKTESSYKQIVEELETIKVEYQKLLALYMNAKKNEPSKTITISNDQQKLEAGARGLYKKFYDIATGNNKFKTKYDSVRINGVNGVLDEIRKHFSTINFSK